MSYVRTTGSKTTLGRQCSDSVETDVHRVSGIMVIILIVNAFTYMHKSQV